MRKHKRNKHTENTAFLLFDGSKIYFDSDTNIIKKNDATIIDSVQQLQKTAVSDIESFKKQALLELETEKTRGFVEGQREGLAQLSTAIVYHEQMTASLKNEMADTVCDIAVKAAEKIVHTTLERQPELVLNIVKAALHKVAASKKLTILANPSDLQYLEQDRAALMKITKDAVTFSIQASASIEKGGVIIQTGEGVVNAELSALMSRLETQFALIKQKQKGTTTQVPPPVRAAIPAPANNAAPNPSPEQT